MITTIRTSMSRQARNRQFRLLFASDWTLALILLVMAGQVRSSASEGEPAPMPGAAAVPASRPEAPAGGPLALSLREAVTLAVSNNLATRLAAERRTEAGAQADEALAALLPNIWATAMRSSNTANLAAMGFHKGMFPGMDTTFIGPYDVFDARLRLVQSVFNLAAVRRWQAGRTGREIAAWQDDLARQQVTAAASLAYLYLARAQMAVEAGRADLNLAQRLRSLAVDRHDAGAATGLDVTRAETRVAQQEVRLAQFRNQAEQARLQLLRLAGLPLDREIVLADPLRFVDQPPPVAAEAVADARRDRVELRLAEAQEKISDLQHRAARAEFLPTLDLAGDYGLSGARMDEEALPTRSIGLRLNLPVFNGGANLARLAGTASRQRQAKLLLEDTASQVEEDVRLALDGLITAAEQVRAAERALSLAEKELEQSQDRFAAGVSDNIDVLAAQTALENSRDARVAALAAHNAARVNLAAALGHPERF